MKMSHRAKRMASHHRRSRPAGGLNLVALMDIFTILVVFLLVNGSDVENLPTTRAVRLPESVASQHPKQTTVIMITPEAILVEGRRVATTTEANAGTPVPALRRALAGVQAHTGARSGRADRTRGLKEVTILADRSIPYYVLKSVMLTCTQVRIPHIALVVLQKAAEERHS